MFPDRSNLSSAPVSGRVYVWDLLVRLFHWSLVLVFFVAYLTEDEAMLLHVWAGYAAGGLVLLRVLWGLVGPRHARFTDFLCGPLRAWRYFVDLLGFRARRHLGHSPAGGMMVLLLMAGILSTVWSGVEAYAIEKGKGPLASASQLTIPAARADRDDDDERVTGKGGEFWEDIHEAFANLTFLLVIFHVGGVMLASIVHRENLTLSMITGWKPVEAGAARTPRRE